MSKPQTHSGLVAGLARGTGLIFVGFVIWTVLNIAFQLTLSNVLPIEDVGRYFEAAAVSGILLSVCVAGLAPALVRFTAILNQDEAAVLARRVMNLALFAAVVFMAVLWACAPLISVHLFDDSAVTSPIRVMATGLPLAVMGSLWAANARGHKAFVWHLLAEQVAMPFTRVVALGVVAILGLGLTAASISYVAGFAVSASLGAIGAHRLGFWKKRRKGADSKVLESFSEFARYRWGSDLLQVTLLWADTLILGALTSPEVVGAYTISSRIVTSAAVGLPALVLVVTPYLAGREGRERDELYALSARWGGILTIAPLALLFALRFPVLNLFGEGFVDAANAMSILILGFAFNALSGPCGAVLTMSTRHQLFLADNIAAVILNVVLNLLLIPAWGMRGAAIAWSMSLIMINIVMMHQLVGLVGIRLIRSIHLKSAGALLLVLAATVAASRFGVVPAVTVACLASVLAAGLTRTTEEVVWFRSILTSLGTKSSAS